MMKKDYTTQLEQLAKVKAVVTIYHPYGDIKGVLKSGKQTENYYVKVNDSLVYFHPLDVINIDVRYILLTSNLPEGLK